MMFVCGKEKEWTLRRRHQQRQKRETRENVFHLWKRKFSVIDEISLFLWIFWTHRDRLRHNKAQWRSTELLSSWWWSVRGEAFGRNISTSSRGADRRAKWWGRPPELIPKFPDSADVEKKEQQKLKFSIDFPSFAVSPRDKSHRSAGMCCLCGEMLCLNGATSGEFSPKWGPCIDPLNNCRSPWPFSVELQPLLKSLFNTRNLSKLFFVCPPCSYTLLSDKLFFLFAKKG